MDMKFEVKMILIRQRELRRGQLSMLSMQGVHLRENV